MFPGGEEGMWMLWRRLYSLPSCFSPSSRGRLALQSTSVVYFQIHLAVCLKAAGHLGDGKDNEYKKMKSCREVQNTEN